LLLAELTTLGLLQKEDMAHETVYRFDESKVESLLKFVPSNNAMAESFANLSNTPDIFFDKVQKQALPCAIKQLDLENYQGIIKTSTIPLDTQWLFLTGENSFGKTTVLQAIAIGLFGKFDDHKILTKEECAISIELKNQEYNQIHFLGQPQLTQFVAYGSSRLQIQNKQAQNEISEKSTTTYSLFNVDGILLNIEYELLIWYLKRNPKDEIVKAVLLKLLPSIADIQITDNNEVVYLEQENETSQNVYQPLCVLDGVCNPVRNVFWKRLTIRNVQEQVANLFPHKKSSQYRWKLEMKKFTVLLGNYLKNGNHQI
jgi:hypothetical protein